MASRQATYQIPVYPLVRKFLAYHYATEPFEVSNIANPFASYLYACLDRYDHRDSAIMPRKYVKLTDELTIGVSVWRIKSFAIGPISPHKIAGFNDFVRQMFFEKLTHEVALYTFLGVGLKTATQRVLDRYGIIEDELSVETALRYYGRCRRKLLLEYCPVSPANEVVILPHERDSTQWQMESGRRQVA